MTPQRIRECRHEIQHALTAEERRGHKPDRLISDCLPEALDEVERLRAGLASVVGILLDNTTDVDASTFEADLVSAAVSAAKAMNATYLDCIGRREYS